MPTDAQKRARDRYDAKTYDRMVCKIRKEEAGAVREHIMARKETLNGFLLRAIRETLARDQHERNTTDMN